MWSCEWCGLSGGERGDVKVTRFLRILEEWLHWPNGLFSGMSGRWRRELFVLRKSLWNLWRKVWTLWKEWRLFPTGRNLRQTYDGLTGHGEGT